MIFYLSSYKTGDSANYLKNISNKYRKVAYIDNALDFSNDEKRRNNSNTEDIRQLESLGFQVELLDLKRYFFKTKELYVKIQEYQGIWVRGGNCFVLMQAFKLSGFDTILQTFSDENKDILYGGYSAGVCVLGKTLNGLHLIDDSNIFPYTVMKEQIWEGTSLFDYSFIPHYKSNHHESKYVDDVVNYMIKDKIPFIVLEDGEVIIREEKLKI